MARKFVTKDGPLFLVFYHYFTSSTLNKVNVEMTVSLTECQGLYFRCESASPSLIQKDHDVLDVTKDGHTRVRFVWVSHLF